MGIDVDVNDGGEVVDGGEVTSTTVVVDNDPSNDQANAEALAAYQSSIPDAFKEKGHFKDLKSTEELFKYTDGLKTKLSEGGVTIPKDDASDEARAAYNKARGVPETHEGYAYTPAEGKEFSEAEVASNTEMAKLLHSADVTDGQFKILNDGINKLAAEMDGKSVEAQAKLDAGYDEMLSKTFGGTVENQDKVIAEAKILIDGYATEAAKPYFNALDDKAKMVVAAVLQGVRAEFIAPDELPVDKGNVVTTVPATKDGIRAEVRKLMATKEFSDSFHPGHKAAVEKKDALYSQLAKL